jgi:hypothetical protein
MSASQNESGALLAGEFYTRKLAEMDNCIALPEHHRPVGGMELYAA